MPKNLGGSNCYLGDPRASFHFDRPQFQAAINKAIDMCSVGEIDGVIVGSVDRLSRDPYDGGSLCKEALQRNLRLYFAAERLDASSESDQLKIVGALLAARAYVDRLKRQTIPGRRSRADDGKIPNGQRRWPFDYSIETGRATPNPEKAAWVRRWAELIVGGGALQDICRLMQRNGVLAPKGGLTWRNPTVSRILGDPH